MPGSGAGSRRAAWRTVTIRAARWPCRAWRACATAWLVLRHGTTATLSHCPWGASEVTCRPSTTSAASSRSARAAPSARRSVRVTRPARALWRSAHTAASVQVRMRPLPPPRSAGAACGIGGVAWELRHLSQPDGPDSPRQQPPLLPWSVNQDRSIDQRRVVPQSCCNAAHWWSS
jgi:hypothetical protein